MEGALHVEDGGAAMERAFLPAALHTRMAALLPAALQWSGRSYRRRCNEAGAAAAGVAYEDGGATS